MTYVVYMRHSYGRTRQYFRYLTYCEEHLADFFVTQYAPGRCIVRSFRPDQRIPGQITL